MSIFSRVTLQTLKKNRTRTVVTIIGVILSAAMICAVTTFVSSMQNYALQTAIYSEGDWHGLAQDVPMETYEDIWSSGEVTNATYGQILGYAEIDSENEYKPYLYVLGGQAINFVETLPVHLTDGDLPTDPTEIILPNHLNDNGGVRYQLGDVITLDLGERMSEGWPLGQNNPYYYYGEDGEEVINDEAIEVRESRTYTVVGFYDRLSFTIEDYTAPGYTAITVADTAPSGDYTYDVYFKMKQAAEVYDFMEERGLDSNTNTDVLMFAGVSRYGNFSEVLYRLAAIVIVLIMFGSISLIYNAFSISVSERTKQFGLLSSIGATKKQLRRMVRFEALVVSAIGIPLGILAGVGGIGVTLMIIGDRFAALGSFPIKMRVSVSVASIVIAAVIAFITVMISAWIPSRRATRVTAVEAIRQNADIKAKAKPIKTSKLTYKLFGLPGMLASKHFKRSKKKYRTTILSLFMSIVLFVSASFFTDMLTLAATGGFSTYGYDIKLFTEEDADAELTPDELLNLLCEEEAVTAGAYTQTIYSYSTIEPKYLDAKYLAKMKTYADVGALDFDPENPSVGLRFTFVNDAAFEQLLDEHGLSKAEYMNPDAPLAITLDGNVSFDPEEQRYVEMKVLGTDAYTATAAFAKEIEGYDFHGQIENEAGELVCRYVKAGTDWDEDGEFLDLSLDEAYLKTTVRSGKTIYDAPFYTEKESIGLILLYPQSLKKAVFPDKTDFYEFGYYFTSSDHEKSCDAIRDTLGEKGYATDTLMNYAEQIEMTRNVVLIIKVFSYGFIVLISLIAAANVFNTISTNIALRRREFAMLKSVGMTAKGFNRMMNYECLLYGSRALLFGLPVSFGITYLMYLAISSGYSAGYQLPLAAMGIATLSVFAVVFVTMLYSMRKIKKDNPIDALKNENL